MHNIAVMADIHGNLKALETALELIKAEQIDRIIVCGDIVGYGKSPNECCEIVRELDCPVIAGNHDWAVAGLTEYKDTFSGNAIKGIDETKEVITQENMEWLRNLPLKYIEDGVEFVHGSLIKPKEFYYLALGSSPDDSPYQNVCDNFEAMCGQVCFVGHSHIPAIFLEKLPKNVKVIEPNKPFYELNDKKAIIDIGSIGQPRVTSKKASFVIYEHSIRRITFKRFSI